MTGVPHPWSTVYIYIYIFPPRHEERKKTKEKIYVKEDMERVGVTEVDARFTVRWRQMIHSKDP